MAIDGVFEKAQRLQKLAPLFPFVVASRYDRYLEIMWRGQL